MDTILG